MVRVVLALVLLVGCGLHRSYNPAPLTADREVDSRTIRAVGDVSLAFALRYVGAHDGAPLLTIWLRNGGVEPVAIDIERLRVRGQASSSSRLLQLQDPRGELEMLHLDAGASGREKVRLTDLASKDGTLHKICIDAGPMFSEWTVRLDPVCFAPGADAAWAVVP